MPSVATYIADGAPAPIDNWGWKNKALPAIHMPRNVSRLSLLLEEVRVERLLQITESDAIAEGIEDSADGGYCWPDGPTFHHARSAYLAGWDGINAKSPSSSNPWVWVLSFRVLEAQRVGRPIIFSAPMIRALLSGSKTQTRRIVKLKRPLYGDHYLQAMWGRSLPPDPVNFGTPGLFREVGPDYPDSEADDIKCPYGAPGDQLWCREGVRRA